VEKTGLKGKKIMKKIIISALLLFMVLPLMAGKDAPKDLNPEPENKLNAGQSELLNINMVIGKQLLKAINQKKLVVQPHTRVQIAGLASQGFCLVPGPGGVGFRAYASKELLALTAALVKAPFVSTKSPVGIMSLFRYGRAHGSLQSNGFLVGRAIDIDYYAGNRINISNPQAALNAIEKVIEFMPPWKYVLGLPRPGGGKLIDPARDFFLPVNSLSDNERSPTGSLPGDLKLIKSAVAKKRITDAIIKNKAARILFLMPDAVDHLHIKAVERGEIQ